MESNLQLIEKALDKAVQKGAFTLAEASMISTSLISIKQSYSKLKLEIEELSNKSENCVKPETDSNEKRK